MHSVKYAIVNTKGGVGKTTTAVHLATMLCRTGSCLLIDGDPQASAASWAAWRREGGLSPSPVTNRLLGKAVYDEGHQLGAKFEHIVVDAGGRDSASLRSALILADMAVIPVGASQLDAAALHDLLEIIALARDFNKKLDVKVLLTRVDPRTKDAAEMLTFLADQKMNVLKSRICERVAFRRVIGSGATVAEATTKDQSAIAEMESLFNEVALKEAVA